MSQPRSEFLAGIWQAVTVPGDEHVAKGNSSSPHVPRSAGVTRLTAVAAGQPPV